MTTLPDNPPSESEQAENNLICRMPSGRLYLANSQYLRGYCILRSDPVVASINDLEGSQRQRFLDDMVRVGDALLEVTGAYRMNYFIAGNYEPLLHAHKVPRYRSEPEAYRKGLPWLYPEFEGTATRFDYERDRSLMEAVERAIGVGPNPLEK